MEGRRGERREKGERKEKKETNKIVLSDMNKAEKEQKRERESERGIECRAKGECGKRETVVRKGGFGRAARRNGEGGSPHSLRTSVLCRRWAN